MKALLFLALTESVLLLLRRPFLQNWSVSRVLEAASWRSNPVFAFYLCDLSYSLDNCHSLGPFVATSSVLH